VVKRAGSGMLNCLPMQGGWMAGTGALYCSSVCARLSRMHGNASKESAVDKSCLGSVEGACRGGIHKYVDMTPYRHEV